MWKKGSTARMRSPSPIGMNGLSCSRFVPIDRCVSITPLGVPVVPELYGRAATSSPGAMATVGSGAVEASMSRTEVWPSAWSQT